MSVDISTDISVDCRSTYRSRLDQYVDRYLDRYVGRDVERHTGRGVRKLHMIPIIYSSIRVKRLVKSMMEFVPVNNLVTLNMQYS